MNYILSFLWELLLTFPGQLIRWLFFRGKRSFNDLEKDYYLNWGISVLFYNVLGGILYFFSLLSGKTGN